MRFLVFLISRNECLYSSLYFLVDRSLFILVLWVIPPPIFIVGNVGNVGIFGIDALPRRDCAAPFTFALHLLVHLLVHY